MFFISQREFMRPPPLREIPCRKSRYMTESPRKVSLPESGAYLDKEIDNIVEACNTIGKAVLGGKDARLTVEQIKAFNRQVLDGLPLDEECTPEEFRKHSVGVARYRSVLEGLRVLSRPPVPMAQRKTGTAGCRGRHGICHNQSHDRPPLYCVDTPICRWKRSDSPPR